jgi:hypothetical protein
LMPWTSTWFFFTARTAPANRKNSKDGLAKSGWLVYVVSTVSQSQHAGA